MFHDNPAQAFDRAIVSGRLSDNPHSEFYAGRYMYMFSDAGRDAFKHIHTRQYLYVPRGRVEA